MALDSPTPHLLHSNNAASEEESSQIKASIASARQELDSLATIQTQPLQWAQGTSQRVLKLETFIHQHQSILSPLRLLPEEILREVFLRARSLPSHELLTQSPFRRDASRFRIPWELGQVCSSWRTAALGLGNLWSTIPPLKLELDIKKAEPQLRLVQMLLRRSGQAPLSIFAYSDEYDMKEHPVLEILMKHSARWKSFTLDVRGALFRSLHPICDRVPLLERLALNQQDYLFAESFHSGFHSAPSLKYVTISGRFTSFPLDLSHVVEYREELRFPAMLQKALDDSHSILQTLTVLDIAGLMESIHVFLPCLVRLSVKYYHDGYLEFFSVPSLRELEINGLGAASIFPSLIKMLSNDTPQQLSSFSYRTRGDTDGSLPELFMLIPNLRHLDASLPGAADLANMARDYNGVRLLPLLETCRFNSRSVFEDETISNALNNFASTRTLKEMWLYFDPTSALPTDEDVDIWRIHVRAQLHGWQYIKSSKTAQALDIAKAGLYKAFPGLWRPESNGVFKLARKQSSQLSEALKVLKNIDIRTLEVNEIYLSEIHDHLHRLSTSDLTFNGIRDKVCEEAEQILDGWESLFRESLDGIFWVTKSPFCFVFIPPDHGTRLSQDPVSFIYGQLSNSIPPSELFWVKNRLGFIGSRV